MKVPCYGCKERSMMCHVGCSRYREFAAQCEQVRQKKAEQAALDEMAMRRFAMRQTRGRWEVRQQHYWHRKKR